jgi:Flp pilus assembly protein TadD
MPYSPEDQRHATAAEGYLWLGMFDDAATELEQVDPAAMHRPEVLVVRLGIYQETKRWAAMQAVAKKLVELDPTGPQWAISWAYATRRAESIDLARLILMNALDRHPQEPLIHYNLACYDCQLGDILSARKFIERALLMEPNMERMALQDEDLQPLWSHPRELKSIA